MTITINAYAGFLTARWDEIEREIAYRGTCAVGHRSNCVYEGGYGGSCDCDCGAVTYVLADLAAKRAILERVEQAALRAAFFRTVAAQGTAEFAASILAPFAEPFRDHPDHPANREAR